MVNLLFVRRTSCPSLLETEFDTASRLRFGGPAVAYGSAVNEETGCKLASIVDSAPLCTTDILSVASMSMTCSSAARIAFSGRATERATDKMSVVHGEVHHDRSPLGNACTAFLVYRRAVGDGRDS